MSDVVDLLVVDVGNTSTKYTAFADNAVLWQVRDGLLESKLPFEPQAIYFASVRSVDDSMRLQSSLQVKFPLALWCELNSEAESCGVRNAYVEPHRLGIDRWLTVVAAYHLYGGDVVVFDAGTAIKIDVVNKSGQHLGGYIVPGLAMMENALLTNTAKIRYQDSERQRGDGLPNSTARAVTEGCHEMALGFLQRVYAQYSSFTWLVTGGDGRALLSKVGISAEYDANLVALGAKLVGDESVRSRV